jgi:hypothetical protein
MTVEQKFLNREVWAKRGLGQIRGTVVEARMVWSGYWKLLIQRPDGSIPFWVNSRQCKLV